MSIRQMFPGSIVKPGFNPLATPPIVYTYNLYSWGQNGSGQLGISNTFGYSSPKQVGSLTNWLSLAANGYASFGIKTDGTIWSWGNNTNGNLGLGNRTNYSSPKQIGALTSWLQVSAGFYFGNAMAIKTDGTLWGWGKNDYGQLGLGNITNYSSPKQVGSLTNWAVVTCQGNTTLAIKTDGTLWSWGYGNQGQTGLGNTTLYSSPKQVGSLTNWLKLSSGGYRGDTSIAIKTDGTLWAWGPNNFGNLGLGNRTDYSSPKQIGALTNWSTVGSGNFYAVAVKSDGTLWAWGKNDVGMLGLGNTTNYSSPKQVGSLTNWSTVNCPYLFSVATKTDGTLWSWGANNIGQLGLDNRTYYSSPKQVGSLTTWKTAPVGGLYFAIGLQY